KIAINDRSRWRGNEGRIEARPRLPINWGNALLPTLPLYSSHKTVSCKEARRGIANDLRFNRESIQPESFACPIGQLIIKSRINKQLHALSFRKTTHGSILEELIAKTASRKKLYHGLTDPGVQLQPL